MIKYLFPVQPLYREMFRGQLQDGGEQFKMILITFMNVVELGRNVVRALLLDVGLENMAPQARVSHATLGADAIIVWESMVRMLDQAIILGIISVMFGMAQPITFIMMENYIIKDWMRMAN